LTDAFVAAVAAVRVNRVSVDAREVRKERRVGAGVVIAAGNVWFRLAGARFHMFPRIESWIGHEQHMFRVLHGREVRREGRALVMPRLPGSNLGELVRAGAGRAPFVAAGRALAELHARGLSHGDVNLGNVLVDGARAAWIDFDAAHDERDALVLRAADDVLGFALDLLRFDGAFGARFDAFVEGYGRPTAVVRAFGDAGAPTGWLAAGLARARAHGAPAARVDEGLAVARAIFDR
jgi:hypothetical protein